jgi:hypothetical protein
MFAVGFKHSITLISGPKWVSGTLIQKFKELMRLRGFLSRLARVARNFSQKLLSKFYACRTELMRVGAEFFPAGNTPRQHRSEGTTVLVTL